MKICHIHIKFLAVPSAQIYRILPKFICSSNYLQNSKIADSAILSYICGKQLVFGIHIMQHDKINKLEN